jgi:hypothetical protein
MIHEDKLAKLRREYFKRIDYKFVDDRVAEIYRQKIKELTPKLGAKNENQNTNN